MASREQLETALRNAHNAGDEVAARQLARAIQQGGFDQPPTENIPTLMGATREALQGVTFGLADEIASGVTAGIVAPFDKYRTFGDIYKDSMAQFQREREGFKESNPVLATTSEIGGALLTGGTGAVKALLKLAPQGSSKLRKALALSGIGAAEGGLYGFASGDGVDDRLSGLGYGAGTGALLTPIVGPILGLLGGTAKNAGQWALRKITDTPKKEVERALKIAADAEGLDPEQAYKLMQDLGPDATLMDLGDNFRMLARTQASKVGPAKTQVNKFIDERQKGQQGRLLEAIETSSGLSGKDFKGSVNALSQRMKAQASPLYEAAYATPFEITPKIQAIISKGSGKAAFNRGQKAFNDEVGAGFSGGNVQLFDFVKRELDDMASAAARSGKKNKARQITNLKNELVAELDAAVPEYALARKIWETGSSGKEAADLGQNLFKTHPDDLADEIANMTDAEQRLFRMGGMRAVEDALGNRGVSGDAGKFLSDKPFMKKRLGLLFDNPDAVLKQIEAEAAFTQTKNTVRGGSVTHEAQTTASDFDDLVTPGLLTAAVTGNTTDMLAGNVARLLTRNKVSTEAVTDLTNRLLSQGLTKKQITDIFKTKEVKQAAGKDLTSEVSQILKYSTAPLGVLAQGDDQ